MNRPLACLAVIASLALPRPGRAAEARTGAARPAATSASRAPKPAARGTAAPDPSAARRLDDIHIEGEIAVPQVLFITAREQRRFMEFQDRRYLRTSAQLGAASVAPRWMIVSHTPVTAGKETAR